MRMAPHREGPPTTEPPPTRGPAGPRVHLADQAVTKAMCQSGSKQVSACIGEMEATARHCNVDRGYLHINARTGDSGIDRLKRQRQG